MSDLMMIFAVGIGLTGLAHLLTGPLVAWIQSLPASWRLQDYSLDSRFFWLVVLTTTFGVILSFTRARRLEGVGASNVGSVFLYILIATIGMQMDLKTLVDRRSEEHTSELQSLMRISYAVFCLKKKKTKPDQ